MRLPGLPVDIPLPMDLITRALDDLHAIAEAARTFPAFERRLDERFETVEEGLAVLKSLDDQATEILRLFEETIPMIQEAVASAEELKRAAAVLAEASGPLADAAGPLAKTAEPLTGAAERLGRIADMFPTPRPPKAPKPSRAERRAGRKIESPNEAVPE